MKVKHHLLCCTFPADILSFLYNTLPCNTASEWKNKWAVFIMTPSCFSSNINIPPHLLLLASSPLYTFSLFLLLFQSSIKALHCSLFLADSSSEAAVWSLGGDGTEKCLNFSFRCLLTFRDSPPPTRGAKKQQKRRKKTIIHKHQGLLGWECKCMQTVFMEMHGWKTSI